LKFDDQIFKNDDVSPIKWIFSIWNFTF